MPNTEFRLCYGYDDLLLVPRYSDLKSRSEADPSFTFGEDKYKLPIIMSPMDLVCTKEMIDFFTQNDLCPTLHRYFKCVEDQIAFWRELESPEKVWVCVGSLQKYKNWIDTVLSHGVKKILVDMANGESSLCIHTTEYLKSKENVNVIAGAVVTRSGFNRLQSLMGPGDGIRCGIASGSICATTLATGFGVPQATAVLDCASIKNGDVILIADGGVKTTGDAAKAIALGADCVMMGKMLAGSSLAGGTLYDSEKNPLQNDQRHKAKFRLYHGMASKEARIGVMQYASVEGVEGLVPYSGETSNIIRDIELNLKASLSYGGSRNWSQFKRNVKIVRAAFGGYLEKLTHVISK